MKKILKNRRDKLFSKILENQGTPLKEIGIPEKSAWQSHEEIDESDYLPGGAEQKVDRFMKPMASISKTVDTKQEAADLIKMVLSNVKELVGDKLTPREIAASLKLVLKDMAADAKKVTSDVASDIEKVVGQNEAHVVISPEDEEQDAEDNFEDEEEEEINLSEGENNPWAICTASVGRDNEKKYEDCVKAVKKQNK